MNGMDAIVIERSLLETLRDYLAAPQQTGGRFPMETHRAEADGVDYLLADLNAVLDT